MKTLVPFATRVVIPLLLVAVGACGRITVRSHHEPGTGFSGLRTYSWVPDPKILSLHPLVRSTELDERIRSTVDRELAAKGYRKSDSEQGDFVVRYWASVAREMGSKKIRERPTYDGYSVWRPWRPRGTNTHTYSYDQKEGSLVIYILRSATGNPIWTGVAEAVLREKASQQERRQRLDSTIRRMLSKFPPD